MRTTLTLADDVDALVRREAIRTRRRIRDVINDAIRAGLSPKRDAVVVPPKAFRTPVFHVGRVLVENLDDVESVLDLAEGERRR